MAEINVTPLVDVMLVLLIIFMVTAPLLTAGVSVDLPEARAKALETDQKPLQLSMDRTGTLYVDDQELSPQVFLRADKGLDYGRVMRVMGELNRAGLNRVALVTIEGE
jgi:biopolymer transport protein TolR